MFKILLILCVFQLGLIACSSKQDKKGANAAKPAVQQQQTVNEYPDIVLTLENGEQVGTKNLEGKNIFVFFQPDCDHCQHEARDIEERLDGFKDYTLYFISSSPMPQITKFAADYKLDNKENVKFAWTSAEGVINHYGPFQTPSVYIYSQGKLMKSFNGQTDVENILNSL